MSKELEIFDRLPIVTDTIKGPYVVNDLKIIKEALKAFEIIKNKEVIMPDFMESVRTFDFTYRHYLNYSKNYSWKLLTEEEFDLLKEELRND